MYKQQAAYKLQDRGLGGTSSHVSGQSAHTLCPAPDVNFPRGQVVHELAPAAAEMAPARTRGIDGSGVCHARLLFSKSHDWKGAHGSKN